MGHTGAADWSWARKAREAVSIPVIDNGDVRTADDVVRALAETGCAGVMIGRAAFDHPWVFREAHARLAGGAIPGPKEAERFAMYARIARANTEARGERRAIPMTRRHLHVLGPRALALRPTLFRTTTLEETLTLLDGAAQPLAS